MGYLGRRDSRPAECGGWRRRGVRLRGLLFAVGLELMVLVMGKRPCGMSEPRGTLLPRVARGGVLGHGWQGSRRHCVGLGFRLL